MENDFSVNATVEKLNIFVSWVWNTADVQMLLYSHDHLQWAFSLWAAAQSLLMKSLFPLQSRLLPWRQTQQEGEWRVLTSLRDPPPQAPFLKSSEHCWDTRLKFILLLLNISRDANSAWTSIVFTHQSIHFYSVKLYEHFCSKMKDLKEQFNFLGKG